MSLVDLLEDDPTQPFDDPVVNEARKRFDRCAEWEGDARKRFVQDVKFANADADNSFQWPNSVRRARDVDIKPCLTMNITRQHNLQIINEAKQNKSAVGVRAVGNGATKEAADMILALMRHIEYQSNAQAAYSTAQEFQVDGGIGWWRLVTDYLRDSFDQDIFIMPVNDPLSVYMDPDIQQRDGSDARFAFVFDDIPRKDFKEAYPQYKDLALFALAAGQNPMGVSSADGEWSSKDHIRICEYFRKTRKPDILVSFVDQDGRRKSLRKSLMPKGMLKGMEADAERGNLVITREIMDEPVEWHLIVGDQVIDSTQWIGSFIPLIRCVGSESVIEGHMDRKGHTRYMKDGQRMYNYNASAQVEHVALQGKTPWTGAADAIEEYETMWNRANVDNHSYLPYKHLDSNGEPIPPQALPHRLDPPQASPAYQAGMETAMNQLMMVSGQYQAQMGMMGNERTGEAIKQRQNQGDTATYHFRDNYEMALRFTGKQLIELIPLVYETRRILQIQAEDGTEMEVEIDPAARVAFQQKMARDGTIAQRILNPSIGKYDVISQPGKAYGTRREQTVEAMTLILTQNPGLTGVIGDLLLKAMDFPEAQEASLRLKRMVPKQALGQGPTPDEQKLSQQVQALQALLSKALDRVAKDGLKLAGKDQMRDIDVYDAQTKRFAAFAKAFGLDENAVRGALEELVNESMQTRLEPILEANKAEIKDQADLGSESPQGPPGSGLDPAAVSKAMTPPMPGAKQAPDGQWYMLDPTRRGRYLRIGSLAQQHSPGAVTHV